MAKSPEKDPLLGNFQFASKTFNGVDQVIARFKTEAFQGANPHEQSNRVNHGLLGLLQKEERSGLYLDAIIDYITRIQEEKILDSYTFSSFEWWLNQCSPLSDRENYEIRGKIVGKLLPRDAYQIYFPIGMGKRYGGTHFVTAHTSPDLDTTVASFWGWVDAFAARVGKGLHIWNVPGGFPYAQVEITLLFKDLFGEEVFNILAKTRLSLTLTSLDLITQEGMSKKYTHELPLRFDHERQRSAVVLIDEKGYYLGDWRTIDVEGVRQTVMGLNNCLMWLESFLHIKLISCFAKKDLTITDISQVVRDILGIAISASEPAKELPQKQLNFVHDYLVKVLKVKRGIRASFEEFALCMEALDIVNFTQIITWLQSLVKSGLFDENGVLTENRPLIFNQFEILVKMLSETFIGIRNYVERLEVAFRIKTEVFGFMPQSITHRTGIREVRSKMGSYSYLTVNHTDLDGKQIPIGVIYASDLQGDVLGTVSLRDFCNRDEIKVPPYLQVISVIDHHKSVLNTDIPPRAVIGDAQSSNALVAQLSFTLNDRYGCGGMSEEEVEAQIEECAGKLSSAQEIRIYQRLLQKKQIFKRGVPYYVDPRREFVEYLHFIYAILDDTDLLTKVSRLDIECVASLLNRLKSLMLKKEVEVIHFDDIEEDEDFTKKGAKQLLKNRDFYSLYSKVYLHKERGIEGNLTRCTQGLKSNIFTDTKVLNLCSRVGQTKIFARNYPLFSQLTPELCKIWYHNAVGVYESNSEVFLHLHMVSTIASAEELFKGEEKKYGHQDTLWVWIPHTELAIEKLKVFLSGFKFCPVLRKLNLSVEFLGDNAKELSQIFKESFLKIPHRLPSSSSEKGGLPIALLSFDAGKLNSRKAMIAPYLPKHNF